MYSNGSEVYNVGFGVNRRHRKLESVTFSGLPPVIALICGLAVHSFLDRSMDSDKKARECTKTLIRIRLLVRVATCPKIGQNGDLLFFKVKANVKVFISAYLEDYGKNIYRKRIWTI